MAKGTIKINGRTYTARELDFNFLCELGENDIDITDMGKKVIPAVRVYVAYCMGVGTDVAGAEINQHVIKGGNLNDIIEVFTEKASESDFFQALGENSENSEKTTKRTTKKKEEEVSE